MTETEAKIEQEIQSIIDAKDKAEHDAAKKQKERNYEKSNDNNTRV